MKVTCYDVRYDDNRQLTLIKEKTITSQFKKLTRPDEVAKFISKDIGADYYLEERANVIALNSAGNVNGVFEVSKGLLDGSLVGIREIFIRLLMSNSKAFIFTHNHPSGDVAPSSKDINFTDNLKKAGEIIGISLLDHIITTSNDFFSFKNKGII